MSKKSTSRTGNDGNADCGSENGRSFSSDERKCTLLQNLLHKEEGTKGPDGGYSPTMRNILTPNLEETQRNQEIQRLANSYKSNTASCSSLDDDLYGTSDAFNKNLEYLRKKLLSLELTNSNTYQRISSDSDSLSHNSESDRDNKAISEGYLSTRETCINISSPFESYRVTERFRNYSSMKYLETNRSVISTIYEAPEIYESENTASSGSYRVPEKKVCLREDWCSQKTSQITLSSSPKSLNLSQLVLDLPLDGSSASSHNSLKSSNNSFKQTCRFTPVKSFQLESVEAVKLNLPLDLTSKTSSDRLTDSPGGTSLDYQVPVKKRCIRDTTPKLTISNIPKKEVITECIKKPEVIPLLFSKTAETQCVDTEFRTNDNVKQRFEEEKQESYLIHIKPPSEGEDNSARTIHTPWNEADSHNERTKSGSLIYIEKVGLGLNLPSSIIDNDTLSSKTIPILPKIRIIDTSNKKIEKRRRNNRIEPIREMHSNRVSSTTTEYSSGDYRKDEDSSSSEKLAHLYQKYYEDTSDISSNVNSTPSYIVSSNVSRTSGYPSATSGISRESSGSMPKKRNSRSRSSSKQKNLKNLEEYCYSDYVKPKFFDPLLCSSLDVPKITLYTYIFPAFSRILTLSESFACQLTLDDYCDFNDESRIADSLSLKNNRSYKDEAETLLNSVTVSPARKKLDVEIRENIIDDIASVTNKPSKNIESESNSVRKKLFQRHLAFRKKQSTDMSFYSVPSDIALDEESAVINSENSSSDDSVNIGETCLKDDTPVALSEVMS
ncbi:hypothetical protein ILUMI_12980 [Ignelater luminosus]|uniref:Uncharacterized protein n=1 Tax=Ignelater luminosus TaxID=2038154 RepID=A0A8K0CYL2_IGNLU|nr:hypothetical protein ILUMI_12980 [Ignelater luminosus]